MKQVVGPPWWLSVWFWRFKEIRRSELLCSRMKWNTRLCNCQRDWPVMSGATFYAHYQVWGCWILHWTNQGGFGEHLLRLYGRRWILSERAGSILDAKWPKRSPLQAWCYSRFSRIDWCVTLMMVMVMLTLGCLLIAHEYSLCVPVGHLSSANHHRINCTRLQLCGLPAV
jgi:hypothetical protein